MVGWPKGLGGRSRHRAEEHISVELLSRGASVASAVRGENADDVASWSFAEDSIDAPWGNATWSDPAVIHAPRAAPS